METRENPLRAEKKKKLADLRELGLNPFPHNFKPNAKAAEVLAKHSEIEAGQQVPGDVIMAGRLMTKRDMGKAAFFNFQDQTGTLQAYIRLEELAEADADEASDVVAVEVVLLR